MREAGGAAFNPRFVRYLCDEVRVEYGKNARREVSDYPENIVKFAMERSGVSKVVFFSTLRAPEDQVRIMYHNVRRCKVDALEELERKRG